MTPQDLFYLRDVDRRFSLSEKEVLRLAYRNCEHVHWRCLSVSHLVFKILWKEISFRRGQQPLFETKLATENDINAKTE